MSLNLSTRAAALRFVEKNLCENVPICFKEWSKVSAPPKGMVLKLRMLKRKAGRSSAAGVGTYTFTAGVLDRFPKPPAKPSKGQFSGWNVNGAPIMSPCAWLHLHNHSWEYARTFFKLCFKRVQDLTFKSYCKHARRIQIDYLTEDLTMDANHTLKTFFFLVQAHSEAQPYYPELQEMDQEVGSIFSDSHRIQIIWNASNALFHNELMNSL